MKSIFHLILINCGRFNQRLVIMVNIFWFAGFSFGTTLSWIIDQTKFNHTMIIKKFNWNPVVESIFFFFRLRSIAKKIGNRDIYEWIVNWEVSNEYEMCWKWNNLIFFVCIDSERQWMNVCLHLLMSVLILIASFIIGFECWFYAKNNESSMVFSLNTRELQAFYLV